MYNKMIYAEKNIEKLLNSSFDKKYQPDKQFKDDTFQFLEQKVAQNSKESQPENKIVVGLSVVWIVFAFLIFSELRISIYMLDLIKSAVGLSLVLIPVSSIILIILKWRVYEKNMV
ncbi:MAG: hypothetical protein NTY07_18390 [Bacteroidia bacterium]|nr:hypothetical protein [Bacteroidia bacterium]